MNQRAYTILLLGTTWLLAGCGGYEVGEGWQSGEQPTESPPAGASDQSGKTSLSSDRPLPPLSDRYDWHRVTFQNERLSVMMPGKPVDFPVPQRPNPFDLELKSVLKLVELSDGSKCMVMCNDVPAWVTAQLKKEEGEEKLVEEGFQAFARGAARGSQRDVIAKRRISLDGQPGVEFTFRDPSGPGFDQGRFYVLDTAQFVMAWESSEQTPSADIRAFLDTLRIQ
jgi:hypothetical protein